MKIIILTIIILMSSIIVSNAQFIGNNIGMPMLNYLSAFGNVPSGNNNVKDNSGNLVKDDSGNQVQG